MGLVKIEINILRGYINCEHLIILKCKLGIVTPLSSSWTHCKIALVAGGHTYVSSQGLARCCKDLKE